MPTHLNPPSNATSVPSETTSIETFVDGYEPDLLTVPEWEAFGADIGRLIKATDPVGVPSASQRLWALSAFVRDLLDRAALTIDGNLVDFLDEGWVEEVVSAPCITLSPTSLASLRRSLRIIGETEHPHLFPARLELPRRSLRAPLSDDQIDAALYAKEYMGPPWHSMVDAALSMAAGAAASPTDLYDLRCADIVVQDGRVLVTLTGLQPRTVAVSDEWAATVATRLERVDGWWLTGTDTAPHRNHLSELGSRIRDRSDSEFSVDRLRTGCLVRWVLDDLPVDVLRYRAGLKTLHSLERLLEFVDRDPADWEPPASVAAPVVRPHLRAAGGAA